MMLMQFATWTQRIENETKSTKAGLFVLFIFISAFTAPWQKMFGKTWHLGGFEDFRPGDEYAHRNFM